MVKSPKLSDVTDRTKCSTDWEEQEEEQERTKQPLCIGCQGREGEKDVCA